MAKATQAQKNAVTKAFADAEKAAQAALVKAEVPEDDGTMDMKNADGGMLKCKFTLHKRPGAPDPLCITVNEAGRAGFQGFAKRGIEIEVPWFVILHLQNNIEKRFAQEKDERGKNIIVPEDVPGESFSYRPVNPAADNPAWL